MVEATAYTVTGTREEKSGLVTGECDARDGEGDAVNGEERKSKKEEAGKAKQRGGWRKAEGRGAGEGTVMLSN